MIRTTPRFQTDSQQKILLTLQETAKVLGVSHETVRTYEKSALRKFSKLLKDDELMGALRKTWR